jgi:hypothetical protein
MIKVGDEKEERVCMTCRWVKYIGGGNWVCTKVRMGSLFGVMEVHPLQLGCDKWERRQTKEEVVVWQK